jgi:hypothetical protein
MTEDLGESDANACGLLRAPNHQPGLVVNIVGRTR